MRRYSLIYCRFNTFQELDLSKIPRPEYLSDAKKMAGTFFENLKKQKHKENTYSSKYFTVSLSFSEKWVSSSELAAISSDEEAFCCTTSFNW